MKTIINIKSNIKPVELDDFSSETNIFVRKNIQEVTEIDPVFGTEHKVFIYDEEVYSINEWCIKSINELKKQIEELKSGK